MEKLTIFGPERFALRPDKQEVFKWLQCGEHLPCYSTFSDSWDQAVSMLQKCISPHVVMLRSTDEAATVFITLGPEAEAHVTELFEEQRYIAASLLNTLCDEMLFQMDGQAVALLEEALAPEGLHAASLQEPLVDLSPAELLSHLEPLRSVFPYLNISRHGTLFPTKSMMYRVALTREGCGQSSLHDCSRCNQTTCLYRSSKKV